MSGGQSSHRAVGYRMIWRWHFYAGLFVMPMIVLLSITGAIYVFKPQVEAWEERSFAALPTHASVSPDDQVESALRAFPGASLHSYRLPKAEGDAALRSVSSFGCGGATGTSGCACCGVGCSTVLAVAEGAAVSTTGAPSL